MIIKKKCEFCGNEFETPDTVHGNRKRFCNQSCSAKWRIQTYGPSKKTEDGLKRLSERMKRNWKETSMREDNYKRMTENNPMYDIRVVKKSVRTRMENGSFNNNCNSCGNGNISEVEKIAYDILIPLGFEYNKAIGTKTMRDLYPERNYAKNYKPDFIKDNIAIEIDGSNHKGKNKLVDYKKTEFLNSIGITVYRFTNDFVKNHTPEFEKEVHKICD